MLITCPLDEEKEELPTLQGFTAWAVSKNGGEKYGHAMVFFYYFSSYPYDEECALSARGPFFKAPLSSLKLLKPLNSLKAPQSP